MGWRYYSFVLSTSLGPIAMIQIGRGEANLGIDCVGGTAQHFEFEQPVSLEEARRALHTHGVPPAELQEFADAQTLLIRIKTEVGLEQKWADRIIAILAERVADNLFAVESSTVIGPKIQQNALLALLICSAGIIGCIAVRFELRFGLAAALATFHDVLVVPGIFDLLEKKIMLLVMTVLPTLVEYSVTDTAVVFDRIRAKVHQHRREFVETVINMAINRVLIRTIVTTVTVVLVLIPLAIAGGEVLQDLAVALLLGLLIGTCSPICVASPLSHRDRALGNRWCVGHAMPSIILQPSPLGR